MAFRRILAVAALAALPFTASAQAPGGAAPAAPPPPHATPFEPFVYQPAAEVEALTHRPDGKPQSVITSDHEYYYVEYVTRGINKTAEAHGHWYDYIHVLDGEGSITYGGTQDGAKDVGQQEMRGGTIVGGKTIILRPGDRLVVPPGLPHLFTATPGHSFTYLIFKQRV
jgi:mannose-6-phosphate isomerase-like protein (cupin superfamily)